MSKTKYHPMLFSTEMVQAILEGRKTQTRRIVKDKLLQSATPEDDLEFLLMTIIQKYKVGDVLWVRETFRPIEQEVGLPRFEYKATEEINLTDKWKPSLFMPKEACRIFLKIKSIRVERLQSINKNDAKAEGAKKILKYSELKVLSELEDWKIPRPFLEHQLSFLSIWCTINGTESWKANPFVWVYEFEQIEKPLDFIV